jgi:hypothetical protein
MTGSPIAFVAYSSRDPALGQLIGDAVYVANGKSDRVRYETWVYNDIAGNPLISPILDRIEESAFIIADITTLNLNVVYEIGFAIGAIGVHTSSETKARPATRPWHAKPASSILWVFMSTLIRTISSEG